MKKFITFLILSITSSSFSSGNLLDQLEKDIENYRLERFSKIEAAFILSGAETRDSLRFYTDWYYDLVRTVKGFDLDMFDRPGSAGKVFSYLHTKWLVKYEEKATTLVDVVKYQRFNCVAGTILFNLICEELGWTTEAFETPSHTYTVFSNFTEQIRVENTIAHGFDIMKNLRAYSRYLLQFYPRERQLQIGLDQIYAYENSNGRPIDNTELLGLLAYNRAYFARQEGDYKKAYEFVLLAQKFNRDSRSNINFEKNLYNTWGKKLFDQQRYRESFSVFADAAYRYWDDNHFANNCRFAYYKAQEEHWQQKDWSSFRQLVEEISELDVLNDKDWQNMQHHQKAWTAYAREHFSQQQFNNMQQFWQDIF